MLYKYVDQALTYMGLEELEVLGLDQTSQKKHHDYITFFVDLLIKVSNGYKST